MQLSLVILALHVYQELALYSGKKEGACVPAETTSPDCL